MGMTIFLWELKRVYNSLLTQLEELCEKIHRHHPHIAHTSQLTIIFNKHFKFTAMKSTIKLPVGTPLSGHCSPLDAKGNVLKPEAYKVGSVLYSIAPNADGTANTKYSVSAGPTEEDFVITDTDTTVPGTGTLLQDSQDVDGTDLPQASLAFEFDAVPAKAVDSVIVPDQISH